MDPKASAAWAVLCLVGCGPSVEPSDTTALGDASTGSAEASTSSAEASTDRGEGTAATGVGDDDGQAKLDVPPPDPRADACDPVERLEALECFASGASYPQSALEWPLVDESGSGCALVCMTNVCATDACFDVLSEIRIVHDGVRTIFLPRNLEIVDEMNDRGAPIRRVEGWNDTLRVHIERTLQTNVYRAWATDETTGELLWGPVAMLWSGP